MSDLTRIAHQLSKLSLEIEDEYLIQREYFTPYEPFGPDGVSKQGAMTDMVSLPGGAEVVDVTVSKDTPIVNTTLREANEQSLLGGEVLVIAIERGDEMITPKGDTEIRSGDLISVFARDSASESILEFFGNTNKLMTPS